MLLDELWNYGTVQGKLYASVQMWRMRRVVSQAPYTIYVSHYMQERYPTPAASRSSRTSTWSALRLRCCAAGSSASAGATTV